MATLPTSTIAKGRRSGYLATLDGWRAFAILIVIGSHDSVHHWGPITTEWFHHNGGRGVDIFFGLSGLLICSRLLNEEQLAGSINLRLFYIRRLFRIQPAAWMYLLVVSMMMFIGVIDPAYGGVLAAVFAVRNYLPTHASPPDWYSAHFWTLSVEEHFYLILPSFLLLIRRYRIVVLLLSAVALVLWQKYYVNHQELWFGWAPLNHTDLTIIGIVFGAITAISLDKKTVREWCERWFNPYAVIAATGLLWYMTMSSHRQFAKLMLLAMYPVLITSTMLHPETVLGRLLELAPLRFIGKISYSIYLWQMLFFTHIMYVPNPQLQVLNTIQNRAWLGYLATMLCAIASYYLVERPAIRIGHGFRRYS